jgi:hypothetical protein
MDCEGDGQLIPGTHETSLITDSKELCTLISSIPSKILHEYCLAHLAGPSTPYPATHQPHPLDVLVDDDAEEAEAEAEPEPTMTLSGVTLPTHAPSTLTLTHLTSFFSKLTPPPLLHCVRCHKFYHEIDNDDRSCLVPHDDDSAEVERNSRGVGGYETLYGCCGRTVEGEGDMGPPDGWCYEGRHTVSISISSVPYSISLCIV